MKKTHQAKREETNPHDTPQRKQRPLRTPDTLAERVSCYKEQRPEDATNIIIIETYTELFRISFLESTKYKHRNRVQRAKIGGHISHKLYGTDGTKKSCIATPRGIPYHAIFDTVL